MTTSGDLSILLHLCHTKNKTVYCYSRDVPSDNTLCHNKAKFLNSGYCKFKSFKVSYFGLTAF